jgi:hypothetical protein
LGWRTIQLEAEPLQLDPATFGELVHALIGGAIARLEPRPGFARANDAEIASAIDASAADITSGWPLERSVPPPMLWTHTVAEAALRPFGFSRLILLSHKIRDRVFSLADNRKM